MKIRQCFEDVLRYRPQAVIYDPVMRRIKFKI